MGTDKNIKDFLKEVRKRLRKELPKVLKEIEIYEKRLSSGNLTKKRIHGAQFNP